MDLSTETNVERLRHVACLLEAQNKHLLTVLGDKCAELDTLKGRPGDLQKVIDGLNSVRADGTTDEQTSGPPKARGKRGGGRKKRGHGPTPQPELEHVTELFELDEPDRTCPSCGDVLAPVAGGVETSEMIDVVEVSYRVTQVQRQRYQCACCDHTETADGPARAVKGGRYSLGFAAKVACDKYIHHLPLERQVRMMKQHGLRVTSQALWDQVWALSRLLEPVYRGIYQHILTEPVIGLDQTGWPNLGDKRKTKWQMWALTSPGAVYHAIKDDKSTATFVELVGDYHGTIVCDALGTHAAGAREGPGVQLAGCWAHILRKFREAESNFPEAAAMLDLIAELYAIDREADTSELRAKLRRSRSADVLSRMRDWMAKVTTISSTDLGKAIKHTHNHWGRLTRFVDNPDIWLDNNRTERAFRGPVVGRRNHFGSKSERGTKAAAILYSIIESAKDSGVDPAAYLVAAAKRASDTDGDERLMPWDFSPA